SRRRHTRFDCDWSSDVCSSDREVPGPVRDLVGVEGGLGKAVALPLLLVLLALAEVPGDAPRQALGRAALDTLRELGLGAALGAEIGRASCRERPQICGVASSL